MEIYCYQYWGEKVYDAIDQLTERLLRFLTPLIFIGGDEANLDLYKNVPEIKSSRRKLGTDIHELFRYFFKDE